MAHRFLVTKSVVPIGQQHILDTVANLRGYRSKFWLTHPHIRKSERAAPGWGAAVCHPRRRNGEPPTSHNKHRAPFRRKKIARQDAPGSVMILCGGKWKESL